jgi:hypothetical protein
MSTVAEVASACRAALRARNPASGCGKPRQRAEMATPTSRPRTVPGMPSKGRWLPPGGTISSWRRYGGAAPVGHPGGPNEHSRGGQQVAPGSVPLASQRSASPHSAHGGYAPCAAPPMCILIKSMYEGAACALLVMGPQGLEEYRERPRVQPIPPQTGAKSRA